MSIFDAYDSEFNSLLEEIQKSIQLLNEYHNNNDSKDIKKQDNLIKLTDGLFMQSNDLLKQMEVEVRSHDLATKKRLNEKVLKYKQNINNMKSEFTSISIKIEKLALMNDDMASNSKSVEHRQRLLTVNERYITIK